MRRREWGLERERVVPVTREVGPDPRLSAKCRWSECRTNQNAFVTDRTFRPSLGSQRQMQPQQCSSCRIPTPHPTHTPSTSCTHVVCPSIPSLVRPHRVSTFYLCHFPSGFQSSLRRTKPSPARMQTWRERKRTLRHCAYSVYTNARARDLSGDHSALRAWIQHAQYRYQRC